jgi:hypothetical protein
MATEPGYLLHVTETVGSTNPHPPRCLFESCSCRPCICFLAVSAFADVTVASPHPGAQVMSPITVQASAGTRKSQPLAAMAYSLDSGSDTIVKASALAGGPVLAQPEVRALVVCSVESGSISVTSGMTLLHRVTEAPMLLALPILERGGRLPPLHRRITGHAATRCSSVLSSL